MEAKKGVGGIDLGGRLIVRFLAEEKNFLSHLQDRFSRSPEIKDCEEKLGPILQVL